MENMWAVWMYYDAMLVIGIVGVASDVVSPINYQNSATRIRQLAGAYCGSKACADN